ncbi:MAG: flagellar protein FlgN [Oscillospiraceae bacterium]|jgi:hypothetical protein|nr:flagellar protein FlgN [Oscillospiraceae bacterium]
MTNMVKLSGVTSALQNKKEHLRAVLELTQAQEELIENLDLPGLMENLDSRQQHIQALETLDLSLPDRSVLLFERGGSQLAVEINALLDEIRALDTQNQQKARDCLVFLKGQMQKVSQGRRAGAGYDARRSPLEATYFDLKK